MGWARFNPKWTSVWMSCYFCGCGAQDGQKWLEHWDCTFWLFKLYILRKSENVCLMAPVTRDSSAEMHVKHQTSKSVFPLILFTQQDSSCSTIAAEEGEKNPGLDRWQELLFSTFIESFTTGFLSVEFESLTVS